MKLTCPTKAVYIVGVRDGAAVFLRDVYGAEFRCSGVLVSTVTEKVTSLMFAVPFVSWATTPAAPYVFYAMFDLGCKIETVAP